MNEARLRLLGAEHPNTLLSMGHLAATYSKQGLWKEAEELQFQVNEARLRLLGAETSTDVEIHEEPFIDVCG